MKFILIKLNSLLREWKRRLSNNNSLPRLPRKRLRKRLKELLLKLKLPLMLLMLRLKLDKRLLRPLLKLLERQPKRMLRPKEMLNTPLKWLLRMPLKLLSSRLPRLSTKLKWT